MAGILGAQNEVEARRRAAEEARADVAFGQRFGDRLAGYSKGADTYLKGGLGDLIGNISGFFGDEDTAARLAFESDELYRRGGEFFDKGLAGGQKYLDESSIPITPQERSARESALAEQAVKQAQAAENTQAGEFAGMGTPLVDPMASGLDVEYQAENARQLQETIDAIAAKGGKGRGSTNEQIGERDMFQRAKAGPTPEDMAMMDEAREQGQGADLSVDPFGEKKSSPITSAYLQAMQEFSAKPKEIRSDEELLNYYKDEFSQATGVNIDGKPDKSHALMAFGLALMQNRAGKGFNVGKMLSSVGEAGAKAQPYIIKASEEAKAAQLAAGKYALGQVKAGKSAAAAFQKEARATQNSWLMKLAEFDHQAELESIKAGAKAGELKYTRELEIIPGLKVGVGDVGGVTKWQTASADAPKVVDFYNKYSKGQKLIGEMSDSLDRLADSPKGSVLEKVTQNIKTQLVKFGLADKDVVFPDTGGLSDVDAFNVKRQAVVNAFKKLILQESQVSNLDLNTLFASFGDPATFESPEKSRLAIAEMMNYFSGKKTSLELPLKQFADPSFYRSQEEYQRTQEILEKGMGFSGSAGMVGGQSSMTGGAETPLAIDISNR